MFRYLLHRDAAGYHGIVVAICAPTTWLCCPSSEHLNILAERFLGAVAEHFLAGFIIALDGSLLVNRDKAVNCVLKHSLKPVFVVFAFVYGV